MTGRRGFYPAVVLSWLLVLALAWWGPQLVRMVQAFNDYDSPEVVANEAR